MEPQNNYICFYSASDMNKTSLFKLIYIHITSLIVEVLFFR